jgi:uncharacterized phiE125 gp8 family phage protein
MRVIVITPPEPLVSVEEAKAHLRVATDDDDALIEGYIDAACAHIDGPSGSIGKAFGLQTLEVRSSFFDDCEWTLPFPPVVSVDGITYLDGDGVVQTLATDAYEVRGADIVRAYGTTWPVVREDGESVRVQYQAGSETAPAAIRAAILLMVGDMYAFRETAMSGNAQAIPVSAAFKDLLWPYREMLI